MSEPVILPREIPGENFLNSSSLVDLNGIIGDVLEAEKTTLQQIHAIVRHDNLLPARGAENDFRLLFAALVRIILKHPPQEGKLFIYIRCADKDPASDDKKITVSVHTNTNYDLNWEKTHARVFLECGNLCKVNGGDFVYHLVSNTSCLFTINLQGK
jgi:hypothetical protein